MELLALIAGALAVWAWRVSRRADRRALKLEASVEELRSEVRFIRRAQAALAAPLRAAEPASAAPPPAAPVTATQAPPLPVRPAAGSQTPALGQPGAGRSAYAGPVPAPMPASPQPPSLPPPREIVSPSPSDDPWAPIKEWLFGGNTIVKAGVAILFVGLAFLAKYATQHVHVPIEFRLAGIGAVAVMLLVIGWRLRLRRPGYAQVMQGGAVAVLYLTLFVAFKFYGVIAVGPVFALMAAVAGLSAALAVLQDAKSLAVIGALGGFAAPILVSTGSGNYVALFAYYLVLDLGIAAVAWHKAWRALNLIGFFSTFLIGTSWGVLKYQSENYAVSQSFLILYFLLFVAILLMPVRRKSAGVASEGGAQWVNGSLLFGLPTVTFGLQYGLVHDTQYGVALSALVLAALYVLFATWLRRTPRFALVFEGSLAIGTVFLTLVIPFALDARSTAGAWALEGAGLVWLGFRQSRRLARAFGYLLLLLAGVSMMAAGSRYGPPTTLFNAAFFNGLMAAAASLAAAYFVHRAYRTMLASGGEEAVAEPLLIGWATLWLLVTAGQQIARFAPEGFALAIWLSVVSAIVLVYAALSRLFDWTHVSMPATAHAPLMAVGVAISASTLSGPLESGGALAWPFALAVHAVVLRVAAPRWSSARSPVHAFGLLVIAALGALQGRAITTDWGDASSAWPWLGWLVVPAVLLLWLPSPSAARLWPVSAAPRAYQSAAAGVLAAGLLLWTVVANVASDGSASPLPHVPLVNPLDLGIATALFAIWRWSRSEPVRDGIAERGFFPMVLFLGAAFVWLNAMLVRGFHHYQDVPYRAAAWAESRSVQTGFTLLWSITALVLMWLSARRAVRTPWIAGAVLLGAVVLKLLLIDMSGSGTVARIVSFIGVGVLMLVIGYVAPLPSGAVVESKGTHVES